MGKQVKIWEFEPGKSLAEGLDIEIDMFMYVELNYFERLVVGFVIRFIELGFILIDFLSYWFPMISFSDVSFRFFYEKPFPFFYIV